MLESDSEVVAHALNMWANYIQTGDVTLSAQDASNCGYEKQIKPLCDEQMEFILRLRNMSIKKWVTPR